MSKEPRRRRPGTKELLLSGMLPEIIEEFKILEKGSGEFKKNLTHGELVMRIFLDWKVLKARQLQSKLAPQGRPVPVKEMPELVGKTLKEIDELIAEHEQLRRAHQK